MDDKTPVNYVFPGLSNLDDGVDVFRTLRLVIFHYCALNRVRNTVRQRCVDKRGWIQSLRRHMLNVQRSAVTDHPQHRNPVERKSLIQKKSNMFQLSLF